MKKTLIALAVAASAVVSGSAMAWTTSGTGNSVELGGALNPVAKVTPWEVKTGGAVTNLNADVQKGQTSITVNVNEAIPVLGIRNADAEGFQGVSGIAPQIDYKNTVNLSGFNAGVTTVTLEVRDSANGNKIGSLSAPFSAAGLMTWKNSTGSSGSSELYALAAGDGFFGGLSNNNVVSFRGESLLASLDPEFMDKFSLFSSEWDSGVEKFDKDTVIYKGAYGSGIERGKKITITLDKAVADNSKIQWNASLPVTVSYM
ncbi:TPA: hypothetical protein IFD73_004502 [Escherichia coli]|nr:hypothetical protein [Escherichia coli]